MTHEKRSRGAPRYVIRPRKVIGRVGRHLPVVSGIIERRRGRSRRRLLEAMPVGSVCAEIGVWRGSFSQLILDVVRPSRLHLIDPWAFQPEWSGTWDGGARATGQADMDAIHDVVVRRFADRDEVHIHRATSTEAARQFPTEYFDWVYIDGDHHYAGVRADLEHYLPLVKASGYLAGDDYYWGLQFGLPVKRAVDELVDAGVVELVSVTGSQFLLRKAG